MFEVFQIWWRDPGSNWGHTDFQSVALPTELSRRWGVLKRFKPQASSTFLQILYQMMGFSTNFELSP